MLACAGSHMSATTSDSSGRCCHFREPELSYSSRQRDRRLDARIYSNIKKLSIRASSSES